MINKDFNESFLKDFKTIISNIDFKTLAELFKYIDKDTLNKAIIYREHLQDSDFDEELEREIIEDVYNNYLFDADSHLLSDEINEAMEDKLCELDKTSIDKLQCNDIPLEDKNELFKDYLIDNVFMGMMIGGRTCQEPYDEHSLIFDEPLLEEFAFKAKEHLEKLGYEVALFKNLHHSNIYDTYYAFAYADNKESLQECIDYMLKMEHYSLLENENNENLKQETHTQARQFKRR